MGNLSKHVTFITHHSPLFVIYDLLDVALDIEDYKCMIFTLFSIVTDAENLPSKSVEILNLAYSLCLDAFAAACRCSGPIWPSALASSTLAEIPILEEASITCDVFVRSRICCDRIIRIVYFIVPRIKDRLSQRVIRFNGL